MDVNSATDCWEGKHLHFVTGRLAAHSLRKALVGIADDVGFHYSVDVLPITVAALMTPQWIAKRISVPEDAQYVIVPGYCEGELDGIVGSTHCEVLRGPRDLRRLGIFFNQSSDKSSSYGSHDIQIIAEINHAPKLSTSQICSEAQSLAAAGADVIDIGCEPGHTWIGVGDAIKAVRDLGLRVSIDSMNPVEIKNAVKSGASLVLSVNSTNRQHSVDWGVEVVVIPDVPSTLEGMDDTVEYLASRKVPLRIDPVLSPIGFGFAESLGHYLQIRKQYLDAEIMMGVGNLTELTDVDSAAVNVLLLGFCQELGIRSILTTQVIPWAQTSVRECDLARRLVYHAIENRVLPKHVDASLILLRDDDRAEYEPSFFKRLSEDIRDHNLRVFVDDEGIHLVTAGQHVVDKDPFVVFQAYLDHESSRMDVSHAFYMGYEMCKAGIAHQLDKHYQQDESLDWGFLTQPEPKNRRIQYQSKDR